MLPLTPLAFSTAVHDVLIIGGGTAGLTVAARLSEDASINVGVVEAGTLQFDNPLVNVPGLNRDVFGSEVDWNFHSVPQAAASNNVVAYPRGKMFGGSSGINGMIWNRAGQQDYDDWEALGNPGWNWETLLPYMEKVERFFPPLLESQVDLLADPFYIPEFHSTNGSVANSFFKWYPDISKQIMPTFAAAGVPQNPDSMAGSNIDAYISLGSIDPRNSTRSYAATAFLRPNMGRGNLALVGGAHATKIVLDESKRATAVEFVVNGTTFRAAARKEIILSAGTIQSPQLLELSGIGNCTHLQSLGIECLVEIQGVGEHLQDHLETSVVYEFVPGVVTADLLDNDIFMAAAQEEYNLNHTGPLSGSAITVAMLPLRAFLTDKEVGALVAVAEPFQNSSALASLLYQELSNSTVPLLEITLVPRLFGPTPGVDTPQPGITYFTLIAGLMHPFSLGTVHINTTDPLAAPLIDPNLYSNEVDKQALIAASKFLDKLANTEPIKRFLATRISPASSQTPLTDDEWVEHMAAVIGTEYHPFGTCSMLPRNVGGVVDTSLKVYGVEGLRVVDASVIPKSIATHPQQSVYALAARAADFIAQDLSAGGQ